MANVAFKKGLLANLPATKTAGTFYAVTDERALYLDVDASTRIRFGDFQEFATIEALKANTNPSTSALYYVSGLNCLAKWNGTDYVQINLDTGATSVEVIGDGNAITAASYDPVSRKITFTKGVSYSTASDVEVMLSDAIGELVYNDVTYETVKAYVDAKTSGIATDAALGELQGKVTTLEGEMDAAEGRLDTAEGDIDALEGRMDTAEGEIDALQEQVGTGTVASQIDAKIDALKLGETYEPIGTGAAEAKKVQDALDAYKETNDAAVEAAQTAADDAQTDVDALAAVVGEVAEGKTVVKMIEDAQTAATYDDTALAGRVAAIEDDHLVGADKTELEGKINLKAAQTDLDAVSGRVTTVEGKVATLEGNSETVGSVDYKIAQAVAAIMENPDETMNSINELVTWCNDHAADALELSNKVSANEQDIAALEGLVGTTGVAAQIEAAIAAALKIDGVDKYALASDLTAAIGRIAALEAIDHNAYVAADETNLQAAKTYADGLNTSMNTRVAALEGIDHDAYVAADETVLSSAKSYADSLVLAWGEF